MLEVRILPPDCVTRVNSQDSQIQKTSGLTKISQHENSTIHTSIKIVIWVKICKQDTQYFFQSYIWPQIILISTYFFWHFFFMARQP